MAVIEVCVEGIEGLAAAQEAGADRVELCAALSEGGLTPSWGAIRQALALATIPVHVMVRPRGGDFLYTDREFESMREDVAALAGEGAQGIVIGCLTEDGAVDEARTRALVEAAAGRSVTFHRAFDMAGDLDAALETLIRCGVHRVLTSGGHPSALHGRDVLERLVRRANGRITLIGCGKLDAQTAPQILAQTGLREIHFAPRREVASRMRFRNPRVSLSRAAPEQEYARSEVDTEALRAMVNAVRQK